MNEKIIQGTDVEKQFIKEKLNKLTNEAAEKGIKVDVFEELLIILVDKLDFKVIMLKK